MSTDATTRQEREPSAEQRRVPESLRRVACVSVSHRTVPTEQLPTLAPEEPITLARAVREDDRITECVVLETCNRVEIYASTRTASDRDVETALTAASDALGAPDGLETYVGLDAVEHLDRVACGLESAMLGEDQILGQVSETFEDAREAGVAGGILSRIAETAVRVGKTARAETAINDGESGYGGAICRLLCERLGEPPERVLLVGAGEMAETAASAIEKRWPSRIDVANRSTHVELTSEDGVYWSLDDLSTALPAADAIVTATGAPEPVLSREDLAEAGPETPTVDLANPPDCAPAVRESDEFDVVTLADLASRVRRHSQSRRAAVGAVEDLIEASMERLIDSERENRAEETLRALHRKAAEIREEELQRALFRLESGEEETETVLSDFASALTGQLLADPTERLRAAARDGDAGTIAAANDLFDVDGASTDQLETGDSR